MQAFCDYIDIKIGIELGKLEMKFGKKLWNVLFCSARFFFAYGFLNIWLFILFENYVGPIYMQFVEFVSLVV